MDKNKAEEIYTPEYFEALEVLNKHFPPNYFDNNQNDIVKAIQEYADLCKQQDGWIDIKKQSPPYYQPVLVSYGGESDIAIAWLASADNGQSFFTVWQTDSIIVSVKYWQPLPKPPQR